MPSPIAIRAALVLAALLLASRAAQRVDTAGASPPLRASRAGPGPPKGAYATLPLRFEANLGQTAPAVRLLARGSGYSMFFTDDAAVLRLYSGISARAQPGVGGPRTQVSPQSATITMKLLGGRTARPEAEQALAGRTNYCLGSDPRRWKSGVVSYGRVRRRGVYPGIDLVHYGSRGEMEYDFELAPRADPARIRIGFEGTERAELDTAGDLLLHTAAGPLRQRRPFCYQVVSGRRVAVCARYVLDGRTPGTDRSPPTPREIGFKLAAYDRTKPLTIDPKLLYGTYLGGAGGDEGNGVAVDAQGNAYLVGTTSSVNFPTKSAAAVDPGDNRSDVFVAKINTNASGDASLVYSTYLGGSNDDRGFGIAVDGAGRACVTGVTLSAASATTGARGFPVTAGALQSVFKGGGGDAFIAVLSAAGSSLVYSSYLGGAGLDVGTGIAVDNSGNPYVTGRVTSADFPHTTTAVRGTLAGSTDAFISRLNPGAAGQASLLYSTYLGGAGLDVGTAIAVDRFGHACVTGATVSTNFPISPDAFQPALKGSQDAFVSVLDVSASGAASLLYCTYLGGTGTHRIDSTDGSFGDEGNAIALESDGFVYLAGSTDSTDFPITPALAFQGHLNGTADDAFVVELGLPTGQPGQRFLSYGTYLGGSGPDQALTVAADLGAGIYMGGRTLSADFPVSGANPDTAAPRGFVAAVNLTLPAPYLAYSMFLAGNASEEARGIATDRKAHAYVTGKTRSTNFPTGASRFMADPGDGADDAFLLKLSASPPLLPGDVAVQALSSTEVRVSWLDLNGGESSGFRIVKSSTSSDSPVTLPLVAPNLTSIRDAVGILPGQTYSYTVTAFDGDGTGPTNFSLSSGPHSITPIPPPSGLSARTLSPGNQIRLNWSDATSTLTGFQVIEIPSGRPGRPFSATIAPNQRSYTRDLLPLDTRFSYQVIALFRQGVSTAAAVSGLTVPRPPANLAVAVSGPSGATLTWQDPNGTETAYRVERQTGSGAFGLLKDLPANSGSFFDGTVVRGTSYGYRVRALNASGGSVPSGTVVILADKPTAPSNLTAVVDADAAHNPLVRLSWQDNSNSETQFRILRTEPGSSSSVGLPVLGQNVTTASDGTVELGKTYLYEVAAFNGFGSSGFSNTATARIAVPRAPTFDTLVSRGSDRANLTWTAPNQGETGIEILRESNGGGFLPVATASPASGRYDDTPVAPNQTYGYAIRAVNGLGASALTASKSVTTLGTPDPVDARALSSTEIILTWTPHSQAQTAFSIQRFEIDNPASTFTVFTAPPTATSFTDTSCTPDTGYEYGIFAVARAAQSFLNVATADTLAAPAELNALAVASNRVLLSWTDRSKRETGFWIERRTASTAWTHLDTTGAGATRFTDGGVAADKRYRYRVRARNASGHSDWCPDWPWTTTFGDGGGALEIVRRVSFGTVRLGRTATQRLLVRNTNPFHPLVVSIETPDAPFALVSGSTSFTLRGGEWRALRLRFQPKQAVPARGTLRLFSTDTHRPQVDVRLTGAGSR